jgi:hypothetical protein
MVDRLWHQVANMLAVEAAVLPPLAATRLALRQAMAAQELRQRFLVLPLPMPAAAAEGHILPARLQRAVLVVAVVDQAQQAELLRLARLIPEVVVAVAVQPAALAAPASSFCPTAWPRPLRLPSHRQSLGLPRLARLPLTTSL